MTTKRSGDQQTGLAPANLATAMDVHYVEEHDVIQRYLRHALSADELVAFEILLISNPDYIAQVETQRLINAAFRAELSRAGSVPGQRGALQLWTRRVLPLAATLALALYGALYSGMPPQSLPAVTTATMQVVVLESLRGNLAVPTVELSSLTLPATAMVTVPLRIDVGPQSAPPPRFRLQLRELANDRLQTDADGLAATADGWLEYALTLPAGLRGAYELVITDDAAADAQRYELLLR